VAEKLNYLFYFYLYSITAASNRKEEEMSERIGVHRIVADKLEEIEFAGKKLNYRSQRGLITVVKMSLGMLYLDCEKITENEKNLTECIMDLIMLEREILCLKNTFLNWDEIEGIKDLTEKTYLDCANSLKKLNEYYDDYGITLLDHLILKKAKGDETKTHIIIQICMRLLQKEGFE
jgi:hypothetical protein